MSQSDQNKNLESFFREKFDEGASSDTPARWDVPDDFVWDRIEERLPKKEKNRRIFFILLFGIGALVLVGGGAFIQKYLLSNHLNENVNIETNQSLNSDSNFSPNENTESIANLQSSSTIIDSSQYHTYTNNIRIAENQKTISNNDAGIKKTDEVNFDIKSNKKIRTSNIETNDKVLKVTGQPTHIMETLGVTNSSDENARVNETTTQIVLDSGERGSLIATLQKRLSVNMFDVLPTLEITPQFDELQRSIDVSTSPVLPVRNKKLNRGMRIDLSFSPAYSSLKNVNGYIASPVFRGIEDFSFWSNAISISASKKIGRKVSLFAGARYGKYKYQTSYFVRLPFDANSEIQNSDGNFVTTYSHSFPSPIGTVSADYGLLRLSQDAISQSENIDFDLHAKHQLGIVELPIGIERTLELGRKFRLNTKIGLIPSFVVSGNSHVSAFQSHHSAIHHDHSMIAQQKKAYNDFYLSGLANISLDYQVKNNISFFVGGGYESGISPIFKGDGVQGVTRSIRLSGGVGYQLK